MFLLPKMLWNYIWVRREKNISSEQITSFDGHICCHSCNQQPTHAELCSNAHKPFNMLRKHCCSLMHSLSESSDWRAEPKGREPTMQLATHKQCSEWSFPIINSCCAVVERLTIVTLMLKNRPFLIFFFFLQKIIVSIRKDPYLANINLAISLPYPTTLNLKLLTI